LLLLAGAREEVAKLRQELFEAADLQRKTKAASSAEAEWLHTAIDSLNGMVEQLQGEVD